MPFITIVIGDLLILQGLITYFCWEQLGAASQSKTALIPAVVGALLVIFGFLARNPGFRKHAMHVAVIIGLLGFLASLGRLIASGKAPTTVGPASQLIMAILCGVFVALCVRTFIVASRARRAAAGVE